MSGHGIRNPSSAFNSNTNLATPIDEIRHVNNVSFKELPNNSDLPDLVPEMKQ